jgi:hypothetical protein
MIKEVKQSNFTRLNVTIYELKNNDIGHCFVIRLFADTFKISTLG